MNPESFNAMPVLTIPQVEVYYTLDKKTNLVKKGALNVLFVSSYNVFFLQVGDFNYHLSKEIPFVGCPGKDSKSYPSYVFPNVDGYYILKVITVKTIESLASFETILTNHCTLTYRQEDGAAEKEKKATPEEKKDNKTKTEVATEYIYKGGELTKTGLIKGAEVLSKGISKMGIFIQEKLKPATPDSDLNESKVNKVEIANVATGTLVSFTRVQVDGIIHIGQLIGKDVGAKLQKNETVQTVGNYKHTGTAVEIGKSAVHVVASLYTGLTEALAIIGRGVGGTTTNIVQHKYGENAGKATQKGFDTIGNIYNFTKAIPQQIAKAVEKGTKKSDETSKPQAG